MSWRPQRATGRGLLSSMSKRSAEQYEHRVRLLHRRRLLCRGVANDVHFHAGAVTLLPNLVNNQRLSRRRRKLRETACGGHAKGSACRWTS
jgi:hypothetical protein